MKFYLNCDYMEIYTEKDFLLKEEKFLEENLYNNEIEQSIYKQMEEKKQQELYNEYFFEKSNGYVEQLKNTFRENFKVIEITGLFPNISVKMYDLT